MSRLTVWRAGVRAYLRRCTAARTRVAARRRGGRSMASNEDARAAREAKLDELHEKLTGAVESLVSGDDWRAGARVRGAVPVAVVQQHDADLGAARGRVRGRPGARAVPDAGRRVPAVAGAGSAGDEGPAGLHDLRARHGPVRHRDACRCGLVAAARAAGEAEGRRGGALADGRCPPGLRVGCLPDRRRTTAGAARSDAAGRRSTRRGCGTGWPGRFAARGSRCCGCRTRG